MKENVLLKRIIVFVFFVIPLILAYFVNRRDLNRNTDIENNKGTTKGIITNVFYGRSPYIDWQYEVAGVKYESSALDTRDFNFEIYHPEVGDTFMVEYSVVNPENSRLVIHGMRSYR